LGMCFAVKLFFLMEQKKLLLSIKMFNIVGGING
jgi:hypothetical protein